MLEYQPRATADGVDDFVRAYLECAEWCGLVDEEAREALELSVLPRWTLDAIQRAQEDCDDFRSTARELLEGIDEAQAGHDFWLTRNRHGAGFWERGLGDVGRRLTELSHPYGEVWVVFDPRTELLHYNG